MKVRDVFFHEIYKKTKHGEDIVIVSSDIGAPSLDDYRRDFPNRFINVGIAEQNLLAVSSGLQLAGAWPGRSCCCSGAGMPPAPLWPGARDHR